MISSPFPLSGASLAAFSLLIATTPDAYALSAAHINANGAISSGSTGLSSSTHPGVGKYCLLPRSTTLQQKQAQGKLFPQLTLDFLHSTGDAVFVTLHNVATPGFGGSCPSASYIEVFAYSADGTSPTSTFPTDAAFTISF